MKRPATKTLRLTLAAAGLACAAAWTTPSLAAASQQNWWVYVHNDHAPEIRELLAAGADPNVRYKNGQPALMRAVVDGAWKVFDVLAADPRTDLEADRKSTRLNSSHLETSYAVFCLKKKTRLLIHLMHLEQRDRLDCGTRESALHVAEDRAPRLDVDGHAHQRVDHGERDGACVDARARVRGDIGLVRRELRDQRLARDPAAGLDDFRRHVWIVAERDAAFLDVRARDVDLDRI